MSDSIFVLIDQSGGEIQNASLETLVMGQQLASEAGLSLHALLLGKDLQGLADKVSNYDVSSVRLVEDSRLEEYSPETHCAALEQVLEAEQPKLLLMAHIYQNIDVAPKLSARLKKGLVTDCIGFKVDSDQLVFVRRMFRNKLNSDVVLKAAPPWIATVQAGAFARDELREGSADVITTSVDLASVEQKRRSLEAFQADQGKVDLSKADVIVAVGRGIKKQEHLTIVEGLAKVLGAEIGASRPVVDNEWLGRSRQIGSSGQNVSPKLYIGVGISGAIQHVVGMKGSGCIVAINTDRNAPIFNIATYGVVGDLFEIVPALTKKLQEV